jgi:2-polyprenyl-6-methoxyphenol hydroxylase-like FAD-dependent oxidoreductase
MDSTIITDVAIVGGSIAGASLAAVLAANGLGVVVVEREARFRDRIRGESLHPWGAAEAARLGLLPILRAAGASPLPIWQRYEHRQPLAPYAWSDDIPAGHVEWAISHPSLQETLLADAADQGVRIFRPANATSYRRSPDGQSELTITTDDGDRVIRARLVVGADGRDSVARRWVGARTVRDPVHHMIGGGLLTGLELAADRTHHGDLPGAMAILFPRQDGHTRAYFVCAPARAASLRPPALPAAFIDACGAAFPPGALDGARKAGPIGFFPAADVWADRIAGNGVVLVGDAAGANDPSRGHGLSLCFRDVGELSDLLLNDRDWERAGKSFATRRAAYFAPLRAHAQWCGVLLIDQGADADARRERVARARELDPTAGGYAGIEAFGPDGLTGDEAARRHFFGEDIP